MKYYVITKEIDSISEGSMFIMEETIPDKLKENIKEVTETDWYLLKLIPRYLFEIWLSNRKIEGIDVLDFVKDCINAGKEFTIPDSRFSDKDIIEDIDLCGKCKHSWIDYPLKNGDMRAVGMCEGEKNYKPYPCLECKKFKSK